MKSLSEVATLLDVSRNTVANWVDAGMPVEVRSTSKGVPHQIDLAEAVRLLRREARAEGAAKSTEAPAAGSCFPPPDGGEDKEMALIRKARADADRVSDAYETFADTPANTDPRLGYPWAKVTARPSRGIEREISAKPVAGQVLRAIVNGSNPGGVYIMKGGFGSYAAFGGAPAAAYTVTINRRAGGPGGASTNIGTITWAAGSSVGTFNIAAYMAIPPGDVIEFVFPAAQDANAAVFVMNMAIY